jgi:hypothetical protein
MSTDKAHYTWRIVVGSAARCGDLPPVNRSGSGEFSVTPRHCKLAASFEDNAGILS